MGTVKNWTSSYENTPASLDNPGQGDNQIRNLKSSVRSIGSREHYWTASSDEGVLDRQGAHKPGSAFPFIQDSEPTERANGSSFEKDYDEGRLWIDTGSGGRMMYLDEVDDEDGSPTWKPVLLESVGKIQAFASQPSAAERWVPCDGRLITDSDTSPDGTDGGYEELIDFLLGEAGGNSDHPYYSGNSTSAYLPDLRGVSLRGLDTFEDATYDTENANTDLADRDHEGKRYSGSYQEDAIVDHDHKMDHTHGSDVTGGHDSGDGRTGTGSYNAGTVSMSDDGAHSHDVETESDADIASFGDTFTAFKTGSANNASVSSGDSKHHHSILRHHGLTRKTSDQSAETDYDIPDRSDDWNTASENVAKNVAIYWFIKY